MVFLLRLVVRPELVGGGLPILHHDDADQVEEIPLGNAFHIEEDLRGLGWHFGTLADVGLLVPDRHGLKRLGMTFGLLGTPAHGLGPKRVSKLGHGEDASLLPRLDFLGLKPSEKAQIVPIHSFFAAPLSVFTRGAVVVQVHRRRGRCRHERFQVVKH